MEKIRKRKMWLDMAILLISCAAVPAVWYCGLPKAVLQTSMILALLIGGAAAIDGIRQYHSRDQTPAIAEQAAGYVAHELILLNEDGKPVRGWDLTGKTAMVIGRRNREEEVDVDLSDCEYGALVNVQHAVLNFCLDTWYIEDLGSQNGIQLKKVEDGRRYQVAPNRPCKLSAGDVIYIAKTKLLLT